MMPGFLAQRPLRSHAPLALHLTVALASLLIAILPLSVTAQERLTTDLTINQLIQQVLERNEGIQGRILEVAIARKKYQAEKGVFEPDFVASYDRATFLNFMHTGKAAGNRELAMMSAAARVRFSHFTDDDLNAIYDYLFARGKKLTGSGA